MDCESKSKQVTNFLKRCADLRQSQGRDKKHKHVTCKQEGKKKNH